MHTREAKRGVLAFILVFARGVVWVGHAAMITTLCAHASINIGASYTLVPQSGGFDVDRNLGRALIDVFRVLDAEDRKLLMFLDGYKRGNDKMAEVDELLEYLEKHGPCVLKESW